jgi:hypothetical protein
MFHSHVCGGASETSMQQEPVLTTAQEAALAAQRKRNLHIKIGQLMIERLPLAIRASAMTHVLKAFDNSVSMFSWRDFLSKAVKEPIRPGKKARYAHFSAVGSNTPDLPPSGPTDLRIAFAGVKGLVDEVVKDGTKEAIMQIITDGMHNVGSASDLVVAAYDACNYAKDQGVTLVFQVIMCGEYVLYNCWVALLAFFCKMMDHECHIVYKKSPTSGTLMKIEKDEDGSTTILEVQDKVCPLGDQPFSSYTKGDAFVDISEFPTVLAYAYAMLKTSEDFKKLPKEMRAAFDGSWERLLGLFDAPSERPDAAFTFPKVPVDLNVLRTIVASFFTAPARVLANSKLGMRFIFNKLSQIIEEKDCLSISLTEMFSSQNYEKLLNSKVVSPTMPSDRLLEQALRFPQIAEVLQRLITLSNVDVKFYNATVAFIDLYFDQLNRAQCISINRSFQTIESPAFFWSLNQAMKSGRPFCPFVMIGSSDEHQDVYVRFLTELNKFTSVSPMTQYNEDCGLKQILHLVLHNLFCQASASGLGGTEIYDFVKKALQFEQKEGFLEMLIEVPSIKSYLDQLKRKILADHNLPDKIDQQTKFSKYEMKDGAVIMQFLILLDIMQRNKESPATTQKFCESFHTLYSKMICGGNPDCNPERNWKTLQCEHPAALAFAIILALKPADFELFLTQHPEFRDRLQTITGRTRRTNFRCEGCKDQVYRVERVIRIPGEYSWSTPHRIVVSPQDEHRFHPSNFRTEEVRESLHLSQIPVCPSCTTSYSSYTYSQTTTRCLTCRMKATRGTSRTQTVISIPTGISWNPEKKFVVTPRNRDCFDPSNIFDEKVLTGKAISEIPECRNCVAYDPYTFETITLDWFSDPIFMKWLIRCFVIRKFDKLIEDIDDGRKNGKTSSFIEKVYAYFQSEVKARNFQATWAPTYWFRHAFGELDYINSKVADLRSLIDPSLHHFFQVNQQKIEANNSWGMLKYMGFPDLKLSEISRGALIWSSLLKHFSDDFNRARRELSHEHAAAPLPVVTQFDPDSEYEPSKVCHVCGFLANGKISDHEREMLGLDSLPVSLLTPHAVLHPNGQLVLGTINQAIQKRFDCREFQVAFGGFINAYQPGSFLSRWHEFGSQLLSIRTVMKYRTDPTQFMLAVELSKETTVFCLFTWSGRVLRMCNPNDISFNNDVQDDYSHLISVIEHAVKPLLSVPSSV